MAVTYESIASTTLTNSTTSSVTFGSISGSYTDLVLVIAGGVASGATDDLIVLQFNGDTTTKYSDTYMYGNGSSAGSGRTSNYSAMIVGRFGGTSMAGLITANIMNYANSTTNKTVVGRVNVADTTVGAWGNVGLWRSTAAITSVLVKEYSNNNFNTGTVFALYGIKAA